MTRTSTLLLILLLLVAAWPAGCASTDQKSYPETFGMKILTDPAEIDGKHEIFGEVRAEGPRGCSLVFLHRELAKRAMERGADAVLVGKLQFEDQKTDDGRKRISFATGKLIKYK